jgi:hypothetical protein
MARRFGFAVRADVVVAVVASMACSAAFIARSSFVIDGQRYFSLFDDAMISMRYGRTLAEGHGLVWNVGEPAVEGYTNFLWTIWMALLHLLPLPDRLMPLTVSLSGAVLLALCVALTARLVRRLDPGGRDAGPFIGALAVALCYPLLFWTLRGMEVGLLAALILLGVELAFGIVASEHGGSAMLAAVLVLLTLTRPDGIVPALAIGAWTIWQLPSERRASGVAVCAAPLIALAAHTLFRWQYYGSPLPNTYYLKMTGVPVTVRVGRGLSTLRLGTRFAVGPLVIAAAGRRLWRQPQGALVLGLPILLIVYSVYVGGDAWEWMPITNRYVTPGLPLLIAAAAAAIGAEAAPERRGVRRAALLTVAGAIILTAGPSFYGVRDWVRTKGSHVSDDALMTEVALHVKEATSETTRVAVVWAGTLPYIARRPCIDLLGKSDPVIAKHPPVLPFFPGHDRFDYGYSIGVLRPDLVVQLFSPTAKDFQLLAELGYEQVFGTVYARRGAAIDVNRLRAWGNAVARGLPQEP